MPLNERMIFMLKKIKNKTFTSIISFFSFVFFIFWMAISILSAQSTLSNSDIARLGLKTPVNINEAQSLMQSSYKECMRAIEDFNNDKISGRESDEKLQVYMFYKNQYDTMLKRQNVLNNDESADNGRGESGRTNAETRQDNYNVQNNENNQNQNNGAQARNDSNSNARAQADDNPLPHSELVTDRTLRETGSLAEKRGFFAKIFDFFADLFGGGPKTKLLDVPLRTQLDPANGDNGTHYCAPTCLAMVLEYHGIKMSTKEVAKLCNTDVKGTTYSDDMLNAAKKLGLNGSFAGGGADINWLKSVTASGIPVIVYVDTRSYGMADGHCMVVVGVKDGYVYVNDPWTGKQLRYGTAAFNAIWTTRSYYGVVIKK